MNLYKIFFLTGIFILTGLPANAQISPGELSKAHADLEGASNCTKCHVVGNKVTREKCLECHQEIKDNIAANKGYHASAEVKGKNCATCHNEHHGRNFQLIKFNKKLFNHALTGFVLKGQHAKEECSSCHNPSRIIDIKIRKKSGTYLGLNQNCLSCHDDYHQSKMSTKCNECHNFDSWKNAKRFDHSKTRFPLLGKHALVSCIKCHKTEILNGKTVQRFSGLKFSNCTACHEDVHKNKFGQDCKKCHTEESFFFNKSMKAFDHDKTNFRLIGKHKLVDCRECHKTSLTAPLKHDKCMDCHKDYHKGEFVKKGSSTPDCDKCHNNEGFTPSTYTIERHNASGFKLSGAHLATACTACHKKDGKNWTFRNMGTRCVDCHSNVHKGFIEDKFMSGDDCSVCHNVKNWKTVTFDHNRTSYKLEGKHAAIACSECHYGKNEKGIRTQQFEGLSHECSACHKDSHAGQFEVNGKTDCTKCHGFDRWENSKFDHNTSRFKIDGKHIGVKCDQCHRPVMNEKGKYIEYRFNNIDCSKCHKS